MIWVDTRNRIKISRGDDICLSIKLCSGDEFNPTHYPVSRESDTVLYFYIGKPNHSINCPSTIKLSFSSSDPLTYITEEGDILVQIPYYITTDLTPGKYYYVVGMQSENGLPTLITNKQEFQIIDDDFDRYWEIK